MEDRAAADLEEDHAEEASAEDHVAADSEEDILAEALDTVPADPITAAGIAVLTTAEEVASADL